MFTLLHPLTAQWFEQRFGAPTEPQRLGWPAIASGRHTLIAAPTGSGKTLAAFLISLDRLVRQGLAGDLPEQIQTLYVSPLKALSNDVHRNLEVPLAEITDRAWKNGMLLPTLRATVRTGDTPQRDRQAMVRRPPHILVTTPESLYLLLTSGTGRRMLGSVRTVIVDEIHALARDKRGAHLSLSLERLDALCDKPPVRIGLSATQRPIEEIARFLVGAKNVDGAGRPDCHVVDTGHVRDLDLAIDVPPGELSAVCSHETWAEVYGRLAELIAAHRSTLVFVNTRRLAERVAHQLRDRLGEDAVAGHHGSLSREIRLGAEQRLKEGKLKAVVATASLELGIDVGYVDLVCQLGSPRSIATFLQRVGRSGHSLGLKPKGRLFPLSRGELLECMALVWAVREGRLDTIEIPEAPLDILAQQIIAETALETWNEDDLFELFRRAWPYRNVERRDYDALLEILSRGIAPGKTRRGAYLHRDRIHRRLRARRGARIAAATSGGAIPEMADYRVVTADDRTYVGSVNEDFAIESMAGDVFLLGNTSWRVMHVRNAEVVVEDARGAPATIPFWLGEAPGRTVELSEQYARLCQKLAEYSSTEYSVPSTQYPVSGTEPATPDSVRAVGGTEYSVPSTQYSVPGAASTSPAADAFTWLDRNCGTNAWAAEQALNYVASQQAALGVLPSQKRIIFERFFDDSGGMQLVIHSPLGARINRAWGLALRKRFCRSFNFELQASADDNGIVLSLGPQHSFPLEQMFSLLKSDQARDILIQAVLAVPFFTVRWRWNCNRALAVLRQRGGKRVPPQLQRMQSDDLLTAVFPHATACLENVVGDIPIPDHPLVQQTMHDCLHEAMDVDRWLALIEQIESGEIELVSRDTREPSPFSYELLNANPYAFLDPAPLEERRARAVATRRTVSPELVRDLASLDPEAIRSVAADAWPRVRDADELHDALLTLVALPVVDADPGWRRWFTELVQAGRATVVHPNGADASSALWIATENWPLVRAALPGCTAEPTPELPADLQSTPDAADGWIALVRGRLQSSGPVTAAEIARDLSLRINHVEAALEALEAEGFVLRGHWTDDAASPNDPPDAAAPHSALRTPHSPQWCQRRLLARIHRLTLEGLRRQIEPVSPTDYFRFLCRHSHVLPESRLAGRERLAEVVAQLAGFETPAGAWETELLPLRVQDYAPALLDELALGGRVAWGRLQPPKGQGPVSRNGNGNGSGIDTDVHVMRQTGTGALTRAIPLSLFPRTDLAWLLPSGRPETRELCSSAAALTLETLEKHGALFFDDLLAAAELLPAEIDAALSELAALGLVTADSFSAIRRLISPDARRASSRRRRRDAQEIRYRAVASGPTATPAGRWSLFPYPTSAIPPEQRTQNWAWLLLARYGVVFRDLLARENLAPSWWELVRVYRRMEARGEVRGGRFVYGVGGEQYATDEAVTRLRKLRASPARDEWVFLCAADPLNLAGIALPGPRIPALRTNTLAYCDGRPLAARVAGKTEFYETLAPEVSEQVVHALRRTGLARLRIQPWVVSESKP